MARGRKAQKRSGSEGEAGSRRTVIAGRNPVLEALRSGRAVHEVSLGEGVHDDDAIREIVDLAARTGARVVRKPTVTLDRLAGGRAHQGVVAHAEPRGYASVDGILRVARERGEDPFLILLDGVEDPHNLGAILRVADCAGVHGVVIPDRGAVDLTPGALKASAGAAEYVPVAKVANLMDAVKKLKDADVWIGAAEAGDGRVLWDERLTGPVAIIMGSEGAGVSRTLLKHCDFRVQIPLRGHVNSLNVSVATGLIAFERLRQELQA